MKEAPLSGVIYAVLVIVWACVLVPMWVRRNDDEAEDIVSSPSRILPRRRLPAEQRPATRPATAAGTGGSDSASESPMAAPRRPLTPAERRQRLLIAVSVLAGLPALLFIAGLVPVNAAIVGALPLAGYAALRYVARRAVRTPPVRFGRAATAAPLTERAGTEAVRTQRAPSQAVPTRSVRLGRSTRADVPRQGAAEARETPASAAAPSAPTAGAADEVFDLEQYDPPPAPPRSPTWSPVPVPLPTYLTSRRGPAAPRRRAPTSPPAPAREVREPRPAPRRAVND